MIHCSQLLQYMICNELILQVHDTLYSLQLIKYIMCNDIKNLLKYLTVQYSELATHCRYSLHDVQYVYNF
jgi:hypothetical protein